MERQKETFWDHRRDEDINFVQSYIPLMGKCSTPKMERFRKYQNMYYRLYNDGDKPNYSSMNSLARAVGLSWSGINWYTKYGRLREPVFTRLEEIGDRLLDAAIEEANTGVAPLAKDLEKPQVPTSAILEEMGKDWEEFAKGGFVAGH